MNLHSIAKMNTDEEMQFLDEKKLNFGATLEKLELTLAKNFEKATHADALINILISRRELGLRRCEEWKALNMYIELRLLSPLTEGYADAIEEALELYEFGDYKKHVDDMEISGKRSMDWHSVALDFRQKTLPSLTKTLYAFLDHGWQTIEDDANGDGTGGKELASEGSSSSTSSASLTSASSSTMKVESSDDEGEEAEFDG